MRTRRAELGKTVNSPDRSKNLKIKRVRLVWLREWLEELKRRRFRKKALGKEQKMIAEFRAMGDE